MDTQDDRDELRDITARLIHGSHDLIGRLDERDRLRVSWWQRRHDGLTECSDIASHHEGCDCIGINTQ